MTLTTNWPQLMEDEDTQTGLDPSPTPTSKVIDSGLDTGCKYKGLKLVEPRLEIGAVHPYAKENTLADHVKRLKRILREWPVCNYGGAVDVRLKRKSVGKYDHHGIWRVPDEWIAVWFCDKCSDPKQLDPVI